jgi:hypothetical protein
LTDESYLKRSKLSSFLYIFLSKYWGMWVNKQRQNSWEKLK